MFISPEILYDRAQIMRHLANEDDLTRALAILEIAESVFISIERKWYNEEETAEAASIVLDLARDLRLP